MKIQTAAGTFGLLALILRPASGAAQVSEWPQHSMDRPRPRVVNPGAFVASPRPPGDAIVLFDGTSLAGWRSVEGGPARWNVVDGAALEVLAGTGGIETVQQFGDVQLHVEWMAPAPPRGAGQDRGNSGVFLMGQYEVQILDSYHNDTYADGQAGAIYGQFPPLVNPIRPPGEWQAYDIVFRRPRFDADGRMAVPARMTVLFNNVLVQDARELVGPTSHGERRPYAFHADRMAISLQDHGHPVRFRNIWLRPLD